MQNFEKLSRAEMKKIKGGVLSNPSCSAGGCTLYVEALGKTIQGLCSGQSTGPYSWYCVCKAGGYQTNNGGTSCVYAS